MKRSDDTQTYDGLGIETASSSTLTTEERYRYAFDEFVLAPLRILWGDWRARIGLGIILLYVLMGTVGVMLIPEPVPNQGERYVGAFQTLQFPLGTDGLGRGVFASVVYATPPMLKMIGAGAVFSTVMATVFGTLSGYKGGTIDRILMLFTDVLITIPGLPLVIVLATLINPENPYVVGLVLSVNAWAGLARTLRSEVLTSRNLEYVEASRSMGLSTPTILLKDIIPNVMPYILVNFVASARRVIFASVGLYFLGILPFSTTNWGVMMNLSYSTGGALYTWETAHWLLAPMVAVVFLSLGLILFAQGTDRLFNPRIRARHAKSTADEIGPNEGTRTNL